MQNKIINKPKSRVLPFVAKEIVPARMKLWTSDRSIIINSLMMALKVPKEQKDFFISLMEMVHPDTNVVGLMENGSFRPLMIKDIAIILNKKLLHTIELLNELNYYGLVGMFSICGENYVIVNPYFATRGLVFNAYLGMLFNKHTLANRYKKYSEHFLMSNKVLCEDYFDEVYKNEQ